MPCCGKAKIGVQIAVGYTRLATDSVGLTEKYEFTDGRIRQCHKCDEQTWMSAAEYTVWLLKHGIDVLIDFDQLEKLPKLPMYEQNPSRRRLYCRICKCFVPASARVEKKECPIGRWSKGAD